MAFSLAPLRRNVWRTLSPKGQQQHLFTSTSGYCAPAAGGSGAPAPRGKRVVNLEDVRVHPSHTFKPGNTYSASDMYYEWEKAPAARPFVRRPLVVDTVREKLPQAKIPEDLCYKDTELLSFFLTEQGQIVPRRVSGLSAKNQRKMARAVKHARQVSLLHPTKRWATQSYGNRQGVGGGAKGAQSANRR